MALIETLVNNRPQRQEALALLEQSPVYSNSRVRGKLLEQQKKPFLGTDLAAVCTDFDYTFNMNRTDSADSLALYNYLTRWNVPLCTLSGNDYVEQMTKFTKFGMADALPDVMATDVGTELWVLQNDGSYVPDLDWEQYLQEEIGFTYQHMYPICIDAMNRVNAEFRVRGIELDMRFQPLYDVANVVKHKPEMAELVGGQQTRFEAIDTEPGKYKISYHYVVDPNHAEIADEVLQRVTAIVHESAPKVKTSTSIHDEKEGNKLIYNFDVVAVTKDATIEYLAKKLGCIVGAFGDSGNDKRMLLEANDANIGMRGIVGNAASELKRAAAQLQTAERCDDNSFVTPDDKFFYIDDPERQGPDSMYQAIRYGRYRYRKALKQQKSIV